jgi:hypothetical protein
MADCAAISISMLISRQCVSSRWSTLSDEGWRRKEDNAGAGNDPARCDGSYHSGFGVLKWFSPALWAQWVVQVAAESIRWRDGEERDGGVGKDAWNGFEGTEVVCVVV